MRESGYVENLTAFSALLRQEGLAVGLQETADACQILEELELTDRSAVRAALCAVYAKSRPEQEAFYRAFDSFFVSAEQRAGQSGPPGVGGGGAGAPEGPGGGGTPGKRPAHGSP